MHNLDPPELVSSNPRNGLFHTYFSIEKIVHHFKTGKMISGFHYPQYPNHMIMAYCQANKMLGLVLLQADIGLGEQYESGMYLNSVRLCHWQHLVQDNILIKMCLLV